MTISPETINPLPDGLSVIVPVYNSVAILPQLVARLGPVLQATGVPHELILVNDGSRDESWTVIRQLAAQYPWIHGLSMLRNYGQHNAVLAGIRAARFAITVTMDDDLQHPPEELPKLLYRLTEGTDVVYGAPENEPHGFVRNLSSIITKLALQGATGADNARMVSAWRVFRTHLRSAFDTYHSPFVSIDVLLTWGTTRFTALRVRHEPRTVGKSNYTFGQLFRHAVNMMTGFSVLPLQLASFIGFAFTLFGVGVLVYVVSRYLLTGSSVAGFPFLASMIALFSGAQLFALGIIGEYLARMHFRTMDKPTYAIKQTTSDAK
jgi:glycosyltransferase involved in cell wall biosynthesis